MQSRDIEMKLADRKAGDTTRWSWCQIENCKTKDIGIYKMKSSQLTHKIDNIFPTKRKYFLNYNFLFLILQHVGSCWWDGGRAWTPFHDIGP